MTIKESADRVATLAQEKLDQAKTAATETYGSTREKVSTAYDAAREKATEAYESARTRAAEAGKATVHAVEDQPLVALVGGLALGALVAAVLPRTEKETQLLGSIGGKINDAAKSAAVAARDAGKGRLEELGITAENARDSVRKIVGDAASAVTGATAAATQTASEQTDA